MRIILELQDIHKHVILELQDVCENDNKNKRFFVLLISDTKFPIEDNYLFMLCPLFW